MDDDPVVTGGEDEVVVGLGTPGVEPSSADGLKFEDPEGERSCEGAMTGMRRSQRSGEMAG